MAKRTKGEGSVYRRHDHPTCPPAVGGVRPAHRCVGRWKGALVYVDPLSGERHRAVFYGTTAGAVTEKIKAARARLDVDAPPVDSKMTLAAYIDRWAATTLAASDRKQTTKRLYAGLARTHLSPAPMGTHGLDKLKPSHVDALILRLRAAGKSTSTIRQVYTVLRAVLDGAVRDQLVGRNVASAVKRPKVETTEARHLAPADVRRLLDAAEGSRYHSLLVLLAGTGLRRGEALALKWSDVDLDAGTVRVRGTLSRVGGDLVVTKPKTEKSLRTVPIPASVRTMLKQHRRDQLHERVRAANVWTETGYVFTTETGQPCDPRNALRALTGAAERAGLKAIGLHTIRHSYATVMLEAGTPLKVVSELLGHNSISVTGDIYGHVSDGAARAAVDRLSDALGW